MNIITTPKRLDFLLLLHQRLSNNTGQGGGGACDTEDFQERPVEDITLPLSVAKGGVISTLPWKCGLPHSAAGEAILLRRGHTVLITS